MEFAHIWRTYGAQVTISLLVMGIFFVLLIGAAALGEAGQRPAVGSLADR